MHVGTQHITGDNWTAYQILTQLGVNHVSANPPGPWQSWDADVLTQFREKLASYGVSQDMMILPLGSGPTRANGAPHVFLGPSPERDREINQICELIRSMSRAGIPAGRYNITILGHMRTERRIGRGGAILSSFEYDKLDQSLGEFEDGAADADEMWERIDYFLSRVVPVAEEYKVRLACHPQDPGIGVREYRGVARVMGTVDGPKKFVDMRESPYHGLNFCQGTISEMLENPGEEIYDIIRYFGKRKKIFNVYFRNIKGGFLDFVEVFPDARKWNMLDGPSVRSSDEHNLSFDPIEKLFILTVKLGGTRGGRAVSLSTSRDFEHWTEPELILEADDLDQELGRENIKARLADSRLQQPFQNDPAVYKVDVYNMGVFRYEGYYIGMPAMYHATGPVPNYPNTDGFHLIQLTCSRDLKSWQRLGDRKAFIGPSPLGSGAYDLTQTIGPSNAVVRGDELWFYYTGIKYRASWEYVGEYPNGEHIPLPGIDPDTGAICLAVLRRDGFISLDASAQKGTILTEPFLLTGGKLFVNVDALEGELRVEVLDEHSTVLTVSNPVTGDQPCGEMDWQQGNLVDLEGQVVSLRFTLRNTKFYSYWLEK